MNDNQQKHQEILNAIAKLNKSMDGLNDQMKTMRLKLQELAGPCHCGNIACDNREVCNQAKAKLNDIINGVDSSVPLIGSAGELNTQSEK